MSMRKHLPLIAIVCIAISCLLMTGCGSLRGMDSWTGSNKIEYDKPDQYLVYGSQTRLVEADKKMLDEMFGQTNGSWALVQAALDWVNQDFLIGTSKRSTIGVSTVTELLRNMEIYGDHDFAVLLAPILRNFDIPTVMIDTVDFEWANKRKYNVSTGYKGYVLLEIYINGQWYLLDPVNQMVMVDYNRKNRLITLANGSGAYVLYKGLDSRNYGVKEYKTLYDTMSAAAQDIVWTNLKLPTCQWKSVESMI